MTTLRKLATGIAVAIAMLAALELAIRCVWKITGPPGDDMVVVRNRFAPDKTAELPSWLWQSMPAGLRSNVVNNAMAYPDPQYIFRVRPNPSGKPVYGFSGINALGFRTAHLDGGVLDATASESLRILHLGDSCAFGWGVRPFDQTMAPLIERRLAAAGVKASVINLGQPGFTTTQGRKLFDEWFAKIHPNFLILQYGWNDRRTARGFTDRQVMKFLPILSSRPAKLLMRTALYRTFAWALRPSASAAPPMNPVVGDRDLDPVVDNDQMRVPLRESIENYRSMISRARASGAKVLVIIPPYSPASRGLDVRIHDFNEEIGRAFEREVTYLPLSEMRVTNPELQKYFDPDGIHPSPLGVRYIAEAIAQQILAETNLAPSGPQTPSPNGP